MKILCRFVENRLPLFVGGDLGLRLTRLVRRHVQRCGSCKASYDAYRRSFAALRREGQRVEPELLVEDFWPELRERLRNTGKSGEMPLRSRRGAIVSVHRVAIAALMLVSTTAGFFLAGPSFTGRGRSPSDDRSHPSVVSELPSFSNPAFAAPVDLNRSIPGRIVPERVGDYHNSRFIPPRTIQYPSLNRIYRPVSDGPGEEFPEIR